MPKLPQDPYAPPNYPQLRTAAFKCRQLPTGPSADAKVSPFASVSAQRKLKGRAVGDAGSSEKDACVGHTAAGPACSKQRATHRCLGQGSYLISFFRKVGKRGKFDEKHV